MANDTIDNEFWEIADSFIHLANKHCKKIESGKVSAAFLYAASRFNSFIVASKSNSKNDFDNEMENAFKYFVKQYKSMLKENLQDNLENFNKYYKNKPNK